jgi:hypothetical protein
MKKLFIAVLIVSFYLMSVGFQVSYAGEIDLLLQKLVDKGVLTGSEAQQVKTETQEQVKKEIAQGKFSSLPAWVMNTKIKGDVRLRYQYKHEKATNDYRKDTNIGRLRMRLGVESKINEKFFAGVGIATGSGDPRSTNVTFGDSSSTGDGGYSSKFSVRLDYAYAKYSPLPWLKLVGGKMLLSDVLWEPTDLIWDTDITPEGAVIGFNKKLNSKVNVFMNTGLLIQTADTSTNADPLMGYLIQPGINYTINDNLSLKGAFTFYNFSNVKDTAFPTTSWYKSSNSKVGTKWQYNYNMFNPALELSIKQPFGVVGLNVESLKFFGEYVNNFAAPDKNNGYSMGFQFGNEKIEKWSDWQVKYIYAMLEKDSVLDVLPDSDRYSGKTGMRSHEGTISYGLGKNVSLGLDIYRSWNINNVSTATPKAPETLVQLDLNMKF